MRFVARAGSRNSSDGNEDLFDRILDHASNHVGADIDRENGDDNVVVLANNDGVAFLATDGPQVARVDELMDQDIVFKVCGQSLESNDISPETLHDGVEVVPTAEGELERLEEAGFEYISSPESYTDRSVDG